MQLFSSIRNTRSACPCCNSRGTFSSNKHFVSKNNDDMSKSRNSRAISKGKKASGVYSRPSAAIERGSGFYVPGLEGSRVRSLFGIVVSALCYLNHASAGSQQIVVPTSQVLSELITYVFGALLLLQGLVEFGKESFVEKSGGPVESLQELPSSSSLSLTQISSSTLTDTCIESLQWVAASFISLTPATHVLLIEVLMLDQNEYPSSADSSILFQLGNFYPEAPAEEQQKKKEYIEAAVSAAFQSKGGRISVPSTHPAAQLLPESFRRCVLLQRLDNISDTKSSETQRRCLVIGSDCLLPAFTKNDLKWLGSLASYAQLEFEMS